MATLSAIRQAIETTILNNLDIQVYSNVPDVATVPAVVVMPRQADFTVTMGRGFDTWFIDLYVLTSRSVIGEGQSALDAYVNGSGTTSIRQVIFNNRDLGLVGEVDAHISGMSRYGGNFDVAQVQHIGAVLELVVQTRGTS